ncbi:hypothetical protein FDP41_005836 [Naegleria fowleri]|uniref:Uncharacterized protein n=1 Tax=Naegleria fowleri TaxID=5763 RepID=A0A6A5BAP3_NAEFO|nr:uncharacterized protein FDP41_005836 [Naegleria fowleri]KAF0975083.1 hypothetical protein FDP41_005836 [Naegleria fowleri]
MFKLSIVEFVPNSSNHSTTSSTVKKKKKKKTGEMVMKTKMTEQIRLKDNPFNGSCDVSDYLLNSKIDAMMPVHEQPQQPLRSMGMHSKVATNNHDGLHVSEQTTNNKTFHSSEQVSLCCCASSSCHKITKPHKTLLKRGKSTLTTRQVLINPNAVREVFSSNNVHSRLNTSQTQHALNSRGFNVRRSCHEHQSMINHDSTTTTPSGFGSSTTKTLTLLENSPHYTNSQHHSPVMTTTFTKSTSSTTSSNQQPSHVSSPDEHYSSVAAAPSQRDLNNNNKQSTPSSLCSNICSLFQKLFELNEHEQEEFVASLSQPSKGLLVFTSSQQQQRSSITTSSIHQSQTSSLIASTRLNQTKWPHQEQHPSSDYEFLKDHHNRLFPHHDHPQTQSTTPRTPPTTTTRPSLPSAPVSVVGRPFSLVSGSEEMIHPSNYRNRISPVASSIDDNDDGYHTTKFFTLKDKNLLNMHHHHHEEEHTNYTTIVQQDTIRSQIDSSPRMSIDTLSQTPNPPKRTSILSIQELLN